MRHRILFQLLFLTFSLNTIGQVSDTLTRHKIFKLPKSEYSFDLSFRFPVGAFGNDFHPNAASQSGGVVESIEGTDGGMGAETGYEFSLTGNYFFSKKPSNLNKGIRITYLSFSSIPFNWGTEGDYILNKMDFSNLNFLSFKTGFVFRIAVAEKKSFLIYDQACLTYCWNGADLQLHDGNGIRNEFGASFRTGHFLADVGFSFGKIRFNNGLFTRNISTSGNPPINPDLERHPKMPTSTMFLSVGVGF